MPDINPSVPVVGQPDSSEEPKVVTALTQLIAAVNDVDSDQIQDLAVGTGDLADQAVTAAKIEAQEAWRGILWAAGLTGTLQYYKDSLGIVHLRPGQWSVVNLSYTGTMVTLPAGFRPGATVYTSWYRTGEAQTQFEWTISTGGVITGTTGSVASAMSALCPISFRAEN